jgi:hypothetical protein
LFGYDGVGGAAPAELTHKAAAAVRILAVIRPNVCKVMILPPVLE